MSSVVFAGLNVSILMEWHLATVIYGIGCVLGGWAIASLATEGTNARWIPLWLYWAALIIMSFATLGFKLGIDNCPDDYWTALYFSVMTFTTLGYGDCQPSDSMRPFSALEAVIGLLVFGAFVAMLITASLRR